MNTTSNLVGARKADQEEILVPMKLAFWITRRFDQNAFLRWTHGVGCETKMSGKVGAYKGVRVILNGNSDTQNTERRNQVLDLLREVECHIRDMDEAVRPEIPLQLTLSFLVLDQKVGYVMGKRYQTRDKLQNDYDVRICLGGNKYEPIPDGFARVLIIGDKVEGLRMAREEIQHLLELSMDINPNVPRWKIDENGQVKERIKVPRRDKLNEEQKARMTQIMKEAGKEGVVFTKTGQVEPDGRDFVLEGPVNSVMEAKKQIATMVFEIQRERGQNSTERSPTKAMAVEIVVPEMLVPEVIGPGGETVKAIKHQFDIKMKFLGDNNDQYPNGRTLSLFGMEAQVQKAKEHIQHHFIERPLREQRMQQERESQENEEEIERKILIPKALANMLAKLMIQYRLKTYKFGARRNDGMEDITLKGTRTAVEAASARMEEYVQEYENKQGNGAMKNGSSSPRAMKPRRSIGEETAENGNALLDFSTEKINAFVRNDLMINDGLDSDFDQTAGDEEQEEEQEEDGQKEEEKGDGDSNEQEDLINLSHEEEESVEEEREDSMTSEEINENENLEEFIEQANQELIKRVQQANQEIIVQANRELIKRVQQANQEIIVQANRELIKRVQKYKEHMQKREAEFKKLESMMMARLKEKDVENAQLKTELQQVRVNGQGRVRFNGC